MSTWWANSNYWDIGIYMGGANVGCSNPNLTKSWVTTVHSKGWNMVPVWVGLQGGGNSCGCSTMSTDPATAYNQGKSAANNATDAADTLGFVSPYVVYYDLEAYNYTNATYRNAVRNYLSGCLRPAAEPLRGRVRCLRIGCRVRRLRLVHERYSTSE